MCAISRRWNVYRIYVVTDEPMEVAQCKSQSLVRLEYDPYQDDNEIDVARDLEIFLRSLDTSMCKMNDMEVLQVHLIFEKIAIPWYKNFHFNVKFV